LSTNARPLDIAYLTTESTFRLPWIFRALGPSRWFVGMAALGQDRQLSGSALALLRGVLPRSQDPGARLQANPW
jgi:hypothetical protein